MIYDIIYTEGNDRYYFGIIDSNLDLDQISKLWLDYAILKEYHYQINIDHQDKYEVRLSWLESDFGSDFEFNENLCSYEISKSDDQNQTSFKNILGENHRYYVKDGKITKDLDEISVLRNHKKLNEVLEN